MTSSPHERPDRLAVVVVNYRSHALLEVNLRPLAQAVPEAFVVVVDNYSSDAERAAIEQLARENGWHPVLSPVNGGFGAGMNAGARRALELGARILLLLNPDATLDAESLHRLHRRVQEEPDTLVAPVISRGDGSVWFDGVDLYLDRGRMRATRKRQPADSHRVEQWLTGACLAISAPMWERLGGFDEDYFLYWEDVDLSHRARLAGGRLLVDRDARAVHDEGATHDAATGAQASGQPKSTTYYYYNIRNRLLYAAKHLSPRDRRRWALTAVPAAVEILLQGGRRQFRHPLGPLGAAWRGTWDGLVAMRRHARRRRDADGGPGPTQPMTGHRRRRAAARASR